MKIASEHIPFAKLADIAESRVTTEAKTAWMSHITSCSDCAAELARLSQVMELMSTDAAIDAPRDVLSYAMNLFTGREHSAAPSVLRRILAALSFDSSLNMSPAFGVRSGQATTRQLVYAAENNDIDLRISRQDDQWIVAGQLLGGQEDCVGGRVEFRGESGDFGMVELNELCEFILPPVSSGSYSLRLRLPHAEIEIPSLELKG